MAKQHLTSELSESLTTIDQVLAELNPPESTSFTTLPESQVSMFDESQNDPSSVDSSSPILSSQRKKAVHFEDTPQEMENVVVMLSGSVQTGVSSLLRGKFSVKNPLLKQPMKMRITVILLGSKLLPESRNSKPQPFKRKKDHNPKESLWRRGRPTSRELQDKLRRLLPLKLSKEKLLKIRKTPFPPYSLWMVVGLSLCPTLARNLAHPIN